MGVSRTYARLNMQFYWPGMTDCVPTHIRACPDCLARKSPNNRRKPMGHVPVSSKWERVAMDILDITTMSDRGNRHIWWWWITLRSTLRHTRSRISQQYLWWMPWLNSNRTVISMLAMFVTPDKTNWDDLLPFLMFHVRPCQYRTYTVPACVW